jgi:hypothetical protein
MTLACTYLELMKTSSMNGLKYFSVRCFHDFLFFDGCPLDLLVQAASMFNVLVLQPSVMLRDRTSNCREEDRDEDHESEEDVQSGRELRCLEFASDGTCMLIMVFTAAAITSISQ